MLDSICIEVGHLHDGQPVVRTYTLPAGATVADALAAVGHDCSAGPWIRGELDVGVFGRVVGADFVLSAGDRVELYAPLPNDPKVARRQRARIAAKRR